MKNICVCLIGFLIDYIFCRFRPEVTSVWGVSAVAILDSSVNCVCVRSTKKLTMPAYCVAANCNNIADDPRYNNARAPAQSTRSEAKVD